MRSVAIPDPVAVAAAEWRRPFEAELTTRNLRWIWWLTVTSSVLLVASVLFNFEHPAMGDPQLRFAQSLDCGITVVLLVLLMWLRRPGPAARWGRIFSVAYVVVVFAVFDYYNVTLLGSMGETGSYILGVMAVAVLVMLPPRIFLPLLLANHAVYLVLLARSEAPLGVRMLAATDGSAGVLVAGLVSGLLFSSRWSDFQRERRLARSNAELARANAEMSDLMAIAAHDLRSPLEGVRRLLDVVRTRTDWSRGQIERAVDTCRESCGGMVAFIGRLLDAHAVETAVDKELTLVARDLRAECAGVVARAQETAERKGQRILMSAPADPVMVRVEPTALAQALENLVMNALKFSPPGSTVECAIGAAEEAWWVEVRDEGPGVRTDERAALFQKFNRGSARPTGDESSSGLGLFIVKTTVEAMGGRVSYMERETGGGASRGAIFRVELPRAG